MKQSPSSIPQHATEERGLQPGCFRLQETHTHGPVSPFDSHHPGVVRCFHNTARGIITTQDNFQKEVDHLARVLKQNAFPANFIRNASAPPTQETADTSSRDEEQKKERGPLVLIPCVAGMSEDIKRICRKFNIRVVFKFRRTLRSVLAMVKDTLPLGKQSNVVYRIPCSCGQVYIRETRWRLETRLKEHWDAGCWISQLKWNILGRITT